MSKAITSTRTITYDKEGIEVEYQEADQVIAIWNGRGAMHLTLKEAANLFELMKQALTDVVSPTSTTEEETHD